MRAFFVLPVFLLIACKSEPDFDERYESAEQEIRAKAEEIDAELEKRGKEAKGAEDPPQPESDSENTT